MDEPTEEKETRRQMIARLLSQGPISLPELAKEAACGIKDIAAELDHLARTLSPQKIHSEPATCRACGYVFRERTRWTKPSRCPRCRAERISDPLFFIE